METLLGAFAGKRWQDLEREDRVDLLALRIADMPAEPKAPPEDRGSAAWAAAEVMKNNGSSPEGIRIFLRDMGLSDG